MADIAGEGGIVVAGLPSPRAAPRAASRPRPGQPGADEGHHRMRVVEGVVAGAGLRRPVVGDRLPAVADIDAARDAAATAAPRRRPCSSASGERRAVDRPVDRAPAPRRSRRDRSGTAPGATSCGPAKKLSVGPASGLARIQAMPSLLPALHLHHMRHRVLRPAVARLELDARCGRPASARRVVAGLLQPEGVHAEHRRGSRACAADHAGRARAMRSRSMRESPVKKSIWCPACRASASRGYSMAMSSSSAPAACQRPPASAPERCHMRPFARRPAGRHGSRVRLRARRRCASRSVASP